MNLLIGTDWVANRDRVLDEVADGVGRGHEGLVLLVPELISHDAERRLCDRAGDTASRYAQVLSFTRLVRSVSEWCQIAAPKCLDNGGRLTAMAAAARMLSGRLKSYASVETRPEFLTELLNAVDEFKRCCVTPADLMAASVQTQGTLAQKLEELSLILEGYNSLCAQGLRDPRDQMDWVLEQMETSDYAQRHSFYIDGFPDFSRQNLQILRHLIQYSPAVTVSLNCDRIPSTDPAFQGVGETARQLEKMAKAMDIPVNIISVEHRDDGLFGACRRVFHGTIREDPGLEERLHLIRCDSVFDECTAAAERVLELTADHSRYRDIGIVCTDINAYRDTLSLVFRRCGIPVYLSGTEDILEKTAVATVLAALDAALDGLQQKDVLRYFKSILSGISPELCDRIENYAVTWGIRGEKWTRPWDRKPSGLGSEWTQQDRELLEELNRGREQGIRPLVELRRSMSKAKTLADQVQAVYGFLQQIDLAGKLEQLAAQADARGDNRQAQEYHQLWEILLSALEQLSDMLGATHWEQEHFTRLFRLLLSQYDVGTIPTVLDCVSVGDPSAMRCQQVRHLLILGASEGKFPGYGGYFGILTDQERTQLQKLGVQLTGGAMENMTAEFFEIYGCLCGAGDSITVSCPVGQSAYPYRRLCAAVGKKDGDPVHPELGSALSDPWEAGAFLARFRMADEAAELGLQSEYDAARSHGDFRLGQVAPEHIRSLYGNTLRLSASQIDTQAECRLSYFLRYGLRAKERREITIDPAEFGTYVHAVLEETARAIRSMGGFHQVTLEQTMDIAKASAQEYAGERFDQLDSQRLRYLFGRNGQELDAVVQELWQELSQSGFEPAAFELKFDRDGQMPPVRIPGAPMNAEIRGFVDRVDAFCDGYRNFFRVVDYKTGKKSFDYCDVFNGVGLQMLLYLFALEQGGEELLGEHPVGAGVQYFPARYPYLTEDGRLSPEQAEKERDKEWKRQGLILLDEEVIRAMEPGDQPKRLSCKRKSDGTLTGDLADSGQMRMLKCYVFDLLAQMVGQIAAGIVDPDPYTRGSSHSACTFCPYGAVCAQIREAGRRNYKAMDSKRFWEEIDRRVNEHGK